jgi:hypothetical protein
MPHRQPSPPVPPNLPLSLSYLFSFTHLHFLSLYRLLLLLLSYGDEVVFADGSFVDGATAELSADGPLREPFTAFAQGGTHHMHWALVLEEVIVTMGLL